MLNNYFLFFISPMTKLALHVWPVKVHCKDWRPFEFQTAQKPLGRTPIMKRICIYCFHAGRLVFLSYET